MTTIKPCWPRPNNKRTRMIATTSDCAAALAAPTHIAFTNETAYQKTSVQFAYTLQDGEP